MTLPASARAFIAGYESVNTRAAYTRDLTGYISWCETQQVDPLAASRADVTQWAQSLRESGLSGATVARKLAAVAGWYRWLVIDGEITRSPAQYVRRPRVQHASRRGPDLTQARRLLGCARAAGPVPYALICLLTLAGLRVSEACALRAEDRTVDGGVPVLRVHGKGARVVVVPVGPMVTAALDGLRVDAGPLLGLDRHGAYRLVRRLGERAGVGPVFPHGLRHTFVTALLDAGTPLHQVQRAARHAQPATTQVYWDSRESLTGHAGLRMDDLLG